MRNPFKRKKLTRWKITVTGVGTIPLILDESEWEFDLRRSASVTLQAQVIDCDNNGTCETATDGGLRFEVTPID